MMGGQVVVCIVLLITHLVDGDGAHHVMWFVMIVLR